MRLKQLLNDFASQITFDCEITDLNLDSRLVQPGDLFIACSGNKLDGKNFIPDAIARGAVAVICDAKIDKIYPVPIIVIENLPAVLGKICAKFHDYPASKLLTFGITGTNGKTSTTHYLAALLNALKIPTAVIGTLGSGIPGALQATTNTTPDPVKLQKTLACYVKEGIKAVALEVSSHSLMNYRVIGMEFNAAIFTNLTRDHLDYHHTMADYGAAKARLFKEFSPIFSVINADDDFGRKLLRDLKQHSGVYAYTLQKEVALDKALVIKALNFNFKFGATKMDLKTPWGEAEVKSNLLGRFNISNLLAAVAAASAVFPKRFTEIIAAIPQLTAAPGRMECYRYLDAPFVVIDYAHTPDALAQALLTLRPYCSGKLWVIFGCGGDRDRGKRAQMGEIAATLSDYVVITSDNPRTENPQMILDEILTGVTKPAKLVEVDRATAIREVLQCAHHDDIVLIAGKGHETYQIIGTKYLPYSDQEIVTAYFKNRPK